MDLTIKEARRVNRTHLPDFVGKVVRFVGRIDDVECGVVILEAPDGGQVKCRLQDEVPNSRYIEVLAEVKVDLTLVQRSFLVELGDKLDMRTVNETINLTFHPQFADFFDAQPE
eukprot:GHVQ01022876.1.p1 GENE.GHVQ01022876.1~~GHVQ01022876.1.p1  ORF type:complete len:114 (-),score=13.96 GHVQ01022876.1:922-1263(-)